MKNNETLIGWILIIALMIGFIFYQNKAYTEKQKTIKEQKQVELAEKAAQHTRDSVLAASSHTTDTTRLTASGNAAPITPANDSTELNSKYGAFASSAKGEEKLFVLENEVQKITLSNKGGQIKSVELKKYKTWDKKPLILFTDKSNTLGYQFAIDNNRAIDTREFYFEPVGEAFSVSGDSSKTFTLRLKIAEGKYFDQKYTLKGNSYLFNYDVKLIGLNSVIPNNNNSISINWHNELTPLEHNLQNERRYSALYYKYAKNDVAHLDEDKENDELTATAPLEWVSYKQQFFNTTLFANNCEINNAHIRSKYNKTSTDEVKEYDAKFTVPYNHSDSVAYSFQYYMGPNHYNTLASLNRDAEGIIKLGYDFFLFSWVKYITRFIIWVFSWFNKVNLNYGIIILLMTIMLKVLLHPLTAKSIESAAKMKILAPELAALKEKYGDDQTKIGTEQMKLYQRAGVSPFGGCLPLLLQMPILMAMYYFFPASI
jgi:YidC/Oxa1 family membrane protein insertase